MSTIGTREEYQKMLWNKKFIGREDCPFCEPEKFETPVLWKWKKWMIVQNKFPYTGTNDHIMAVPYEHHTHASEFDHETWSEMEDIYSWVKNFYNGEEYFSFTRETITPTKPDTRSVEHYHTHFCPWVLYGDILRNMLKNQGFPVDSN